MDQMPSTVAVFAWIMLALYSRIVMPASSIFPKKPREAQSATMWLESSGTITCTSTPRRAACSSASRTCWSGMKYGVLMRMRCCARWMASR